MMDKFKYTDEQFADIQMLRYKLQGFENLSLQQKKYIYCLSEAALWGRDITFDQFCKHNLRIRKTLENVYKTVEIKSKKDRNAFMEYLKCIWFANGIHHHYSSDKFVPKFKQEFIINAIKQSDIAGLPLKDGETVEELCEEIVPIMFDKNLFAKKTNQKQGEDLIKTSACNYYENVNQAEVEAFYAGKRTQDKAQPSWGLNSKLVKTAKGTLEEQVCKIGGLYGKAIEKIVYWLQKAEQYAENEEQKEAIKLLTEYYSTGDLTTFDRYSIAWLKSNKGDVDFINGFIEVYSDPLSFKGSWESIVEYTDHQAAQRTKTISQNAQWFEDNAPIPPKFRKEKVKGVTANTINAAMLGGDEYPSTAIGINLPNADWIREQHGSKSVTITNITHAYNQAAKGNGFLKEFADSNELKRIERYGDRCDDLHTDLHECLGHGSGKLLEGVSTDALKNYSNTIEEARADLFALYYLGDDKLIKLGLLPNKQAFKASYYTYIMNGSLTQLVRIKPGCYIEEAHMRNRALISRWIIEHSAGNVSLQNIEGKTVLKIKSYYQLRTLFGVLLAEVQRIKSEGDYNAAKKLVETYAVKVDKALHKEVLKRYKALKIAPYKGFINPLMQTVYDKNGEICDIKVTYSEIYEEQMMRYSTNYSAL